MENKTSRTDPRILRTRQLLKDAFVELLQEMEIEKISVNRIAERATINRVTFYLHYRDIPDMLEKMADDMIEDIRKILDKDSGNQYVAEEGAWPLLVDLLEHIAEHAKFYKIILASRRTPIFTDRLLKLLSELITARLDSAESEAILAATGIQKDIALWYGSAALIGTIVAWLRKDMPYTPLYLAKQFTLMRSLS
ncbi:TetR family transcriptional regulator C-terminal domain-containing protein [Paenibacillus sp. HWE-109]|uniref:TetR/AcrR family transcriptional regulator n=1 Tax=Paenibacillus sp. HWE-109 TaxID=1306526 RepID=UPI001EE0CDCC|nr:TetR-like C-terminal domain-containing protein [Paenibacillus sp. HWE-109]UKS28518.1 TetR family transcriptional regulator C-terminal domain-containing protein [Paenibacillus sp. HWE-109]